ncbi:hypothetical protein JR316_0000221 [Psilocybe cubensis]|uniref:Uncharacterized protein n=1 Tax=Psilocybe cubensis TaxID=181762 RepID=A0ACB8HES2_PSICU|nr:hypothetical protein JR316_0000221 [Psilocybe cubensis]KAH9486157.1 hypothetical protein JR316_0000221 [Psilocybe cubensis]
MTLGNYWTSQLNDVGQQLSIRCRKANALEGLKHNHDLSNSVTLKSYALSSFTFALTLQEPLRVSGEKSRTTKWRLSDQRVRLLPKERRIQALAERGEGQGSYYDGIAPGSIPATSNTSYKWSFASKSRADDEALRAARAEVGAATYGRESSSKYDGAGADRGNGSGLGSRPSGSGSSRVLGPAMPSASDLTLAEELTKEQRDEERAYKRKREKLEAKERMEEMVGPKPVGREGMLEKKKMRREGDRAFRERGDEGLELDESTLMGGGDSFREQLARRDMAKKRYEKKNEEKINTMREKSAAFKEKEKATMDMFQQLAKQRFG